ncbi:MAG: hypothetical protein HZY79_00495 [Rhodoblastus sp.]|nr:MAG: hypothetical protein HZY79_00495 [Rhodoblastus sp.]
MSDDSVIVAAPVAPIEINRPEKPNRGFSKRTTLLNMAAGWIAIAVSMALGHEMATLIVPLMVMLILSLAGVYQGVGHLDLRALSAVGAHVTTQPQKEEGDA